MLKLATNVKGLATLSDSHKRAHLDNSSVAFRPMGVRHHGPIPDWTRQMKFLVVGIDYFTKWVKVKALATITEKNI